MNMRSKLKRTYLLLSLLIGTNLFVYAQQQTITGTVVDANNLPILGVNIVIKGTSTGTNTDFDGKYSLNASQGQILEFTFVGFKTVEKTVTDQNVIDVVMTEDSQDLDEVVVTAFGRVMTRNESTSNVVSISSEELSKQKFTDATQALQGKVTGMTISSTSGTPGSAPKINIRGINSITASNAPLYVIDGMPINSGNASAITQTSTIDVFSLINPSDIENISILKDASAVAPYGADGANGVILITTKAGRSGKARYNLSVTSGFQNDAIKGPKRANAEEYYSAFKEAVWNAYGTQFGNGLISSYNDVDDYAYNNFIPVKIWIDEGRVDTDWYKEVTKNDALMSDMNFSVTQGNEKSSFYASLGYNKTEGTKLGSDFRRWSGRIAYDTQLNDKFKLKLSLTGSNALQNGLQEGGTLSPFTNPNGIVQGTSPWARPYNADGSFNIDNFNDLTKYYNYRYVIQDNIRRNDLTRIIPIGALEYKILDNLSFKTNLGLDYTIREFVLYQGRYHGGGRSTNGNLNENVLRDYQYTTQNSLNYDFTLAEKHKFHVTALQEFSKYKTRIYDTYGEDFPNDVIKNMSGASKGISATSTYTDLVKIRYVGLLNYNFDKKYLADLSYSYQGDSRFSKKFDSFYSVGLGWNAHMENFLKDSDDINVLRFKFGYGLTGNAGIGRNQYQPLVSYSRYDANSAALISVFGSEATWEKSHRLDFSVDYGLFNNRISGSLGVFRNKTTDMLFEVPISYTQQFTQGMAIQNTGTMVNSGFEFSIKGDVVATEDFKWNVGMNFSTLKNKVTSMPDDLEIVHLRSVVKEGHEVFEWYLPEWAGIDPNNGLPQWYDKDNNITNDYKDAERRFQGKSVLPRLVSSLSTRFDYKNLFLEAQFNYKGGHLVHDIRPDLVYRSRGITDGYSKAAVDNAWRSTNTPEQNANATFPRFDYTNQSVIDASDRGSSTRFLHKGDHIRMRDLALGYTFDSSSGFMSSLGISGLSFSVRGTNLFTWVKDKNLEWDPELVDEFVASTKNYPTPIVKSITFNINLNF